MHHWRRAVYEGETSRPWGGPILWREESTWASMSGRCTGHTEAEDKGLEVMGWRLWAPGLLAHHRQHLPYSFFRTYYLEFQITQNYRPIP
jgi:hypothetical protein